MRAASRALLLLAACALPLRAESLRAGTAASLRMEIAQMRALAAACAANAAACNAANVAADETVGSPGKNGGYAQHWIWLRTAMDAAKSEKPEARTALMRDVTARLDDLDRDAATTPAAPAAMSSARAQANAILARDEFHSAAQPSWLDRVAAKFWDFLGTLFEGAGRVGHALPWIAPLLEWTFFLGAAAGLGFFVLRAFARQRLQVSLSHAGASASIWDRESTDWARHAEECAARQDWREALHGLYWAAILHLESRRAWRHDPSRTPREYVRLLQPGSPQRDGLTRLTRLFERVWYGLDPSSSREYSEARAVFDHLAGSSAPSPGSPTAAQGAR